MEKILSEVETQRKRMKSRELELNALQQRLNDEKRFELTVQCISASSFLLLFITLCRNLLLEVDHEKSRLNTDHTAKTEVEK